MMQRHVQNHSMFMYRVYFSCRYLVDDQLVGPSRVEAYIKALKRGCRCVECE